MRPDPSGALSIEVELVTGRGRRWWPRPGRVVSAGAEHTFAQLAEAVDRAFGRWELDHLRMFVLPGGVEVSWSAWRDGPAFPDTLDGRRTRLGLLAPGSAFAYLFDLGADWTHLCTVRRASGIRAPALPTLLDGWGVAPEQYARGAAHDAPAARPAGLPPLLRSWRQPA
ncbi:IS1096 element passenger TnpR family protein [Micromonospora maritima]|uniref:IS1096 element passenger TnpR family protein n=1 Tax=Micromonospora maritima TaxID=986711 RepID=UPI0037900D03